MSVNSRNGDEDGWGLWNNDRWGRHHNFKLKPNPNPNPNPNPQRADQLGRSPYPHTEISIVSKCYPIPSPDPTSTLPQPLRLTLCRSYHEYDPKSNRNPNTNTNPNRYLTAILTIIRIKSLLNAAKEFGQTLRNKVFQLFQLPKACKCNRVARYVNSVVIGAMHTSVHTYGLHTDCTRITHGLHTDCTRIAHGLHTDCIHLCIHTYITYM